MALQCDITVYLLTTAVKNHNRRLLHRVIDLLTSLVGCLYIIIVDKETIEKLTAENKRLTAENERLLEKVNELEQQLFCSGMIYVLTSILYLNITNFF